MDQQRHPNASGGPKHIRNRESYLGRHNLFCTLTNGKIPRHQVSPQQIRQFLNDCLNYDFYISFQHGVDSWPDLDRQAITNGELWGTYPPRKSASMRNPAGCGTRPITWVFAPSCFHSAYSGPKTQKAPRRELIEKSGKPQISGCFVGCGSRI